MGALIDMTGKKCGTLTVLSRHGKTRQARWLCRCDCGVERLYYGNHLRAGTASCYCDKGRDEHGLVDDPLYDVWAGMKRRCADKNQARYGGRGISVCKAWSDSFVEFREWALKNGWKNGLEIDRRNNDGNYEPGNCRFVNDQTNSRNRRSNRALTFNGETRLIVEWSELLGIPEKRITNRLNALGWSVERTLSTPNMSVAESNRYRHLKEKKA
jgi:hypothetical protein